MEKINKNEFNIEEIIIKYTNYIYKIIKNSTIYLSNEDIEEIIEDVFLVLWNNKEKINYKLSLEPYIAGITKNIIKLKYRKLKINDNIDNYENIIQNNIDIQNIIEQEEKNKIIEKTLNQMKEKDKKIFILFYYNSKSTKEIAKDLKITEINVKTKLYRIRKKLKNALIKGGYSYGK